MGEQNVTNLIIIVCNKYYIKCRLKRAGERKGEMNRVYESGTIRQKSEQSIVTFSKTDSEIDIYVYKYCLFVQKTNGKGCCINNARRYNDDIMDDDNNNNIMQY